MSQSLQTFSINNPGYLGVNLQDAPGELPPGFALKAYNCVIDKSGRIASRNGWVKSHAANTDLGASDITCLGELIENNGTVTLLAAGGAFLFKLVGSTLTTLTYGGGGAAPVISAANWQFTQLNGIGIFFQRGYDPLIYDPSVSTTTFRRLSEHGTYSGTVLLANTAISAYGRIWCADTTTDKNTIKWSDIITPQVWTAGTSGSLNLLGVWPSGGDEIVALAAHNNALIIFGKKQMLVYSGANAPSTMSLSDAVTNIGCIARDSVQNIGTDVLFLSSSGVRSLSRTIQEKSAPVGNVSKNVHNGLQTLLNTQNLDNVKSVYSPVDAFYLLTLPSFDETYCFDTKVPLEDGALRVTTWYGITPRAFLATSGRKLYLGRPGYIGQYTGFVDDTTAFRMVYSTPWLDLDNPILTSILKRIAVSIIGGVNQTLVLKWGYDFIPDLFSQTVTVTSAATPAEWGVMEWGTMEWGSVIDVSTVIANGAGSGRRLQISVEAQISTGRVAVQALDIFTKSGRV